MTLLAPRVTPPEQLSLLEYVPRTFYVYVIENSVNDKVYVGKATDVGRRWTQHKCAAKSGRGDQVLYRAMRKHGIDKFSIRTIHECATEEEAYRMEAVFVEKFGSMLPPHGNGYNMTAGGLGGGKIARQWATEDEVREALDAFEAANGRKLDGPEYERIRFDLGENLPARTFFKSFYGKTYIEIRDGVRGKGRVWAPVPVVRAKLAEWADEHGRLLGQYEYNDVRVEWGPLYPDYSNFVKIYGLTYCEVRDGERGHDGVWAPVETVRARMAEWAAEHGRPIQAKEYDVVRVEWGEDFPVFSNFDRVYHMTFCEVRDGERGRDKDWAPVDEIRTKLAEWADANGRKMQKEEYNARRKQWGSRFPCSTRFPDIYGMTYAEVRDGARYYERAWMPLEELRGHIAAWQSAHGKTLTQTEYKRVRKEWGPNVPCEAMLMSAYGMWFGPIRDGAKSI
jgi:group I intron endonuclease